MFKGRSKAEFLDVILALLDRDDEKTGIWMAMELVLRKHTGHEAVRKLLDRAIDLMKDTEDTDKVHKWLMHVGITSTTDPLFNKWILKSNSIHEVWQKAATARVDNDKGKGGKTSELPDWESRRSVTKV